MLKSNYIEDIFIEFYRRFLNLFPLTYGQEMDALHSFYELCVDSKPFTEKQAGYMIMLMKKFKHDVCEQDFDYNDAIITPKFKNPFRVIDSNKKIYIDKASDGKISICFKFPFGFKATFDKEITECVRNRNTGTYDSELQVRKISFFDVNPISVYEFAVKYHFEIDDSIMYAVAETETAWGNIDHLTPTSTVVENNVIFGGKNEISHEFFAEHSTKNISKNLFLSKTMGYPVSLGRTPTTVLEKIVTEKSNTFWLEETSDLLKIYKELECKICVIIDRTDVKQVWIKEFVSDAAALGITASKIKVCFRESSDQDQGFNSWVKESGHGGKVDEGDIFLFDHKPAKWLFKNPNLITIVVTTSKFPPTASLTRDWIESHPCAIYLSDIKPTVKGNKKLVKL
jgi:hypothetical protein